MSCKASDGHWYNIKTEVDGNGKSRIIPVTSIIWPDQESLDEMTKNLTFEAGVPLEIRYRI